MSNLTQDVQRRLDRQASLSDSSLRSPSLVTVAMASKRDQFLTACRASKLDTVRWGLGAGGQTPGVRDDDGFTAIMLTVFGNKHKALQMLLDNCRRSRIKEPIDFVDGQGDEKTALMYAAELGFEESVDELLYAGANHKLKCAKGLSAADYARKNKFDALARRIDRGGESSEEEDDGEVEVVEAGFEDETSTQRSKRKKREMEALERRGERSAPEKGAANGARESEDGASAGAPEARWPETVKAKESEAKEVSVERDKGDTEVDPALFYVSSINNLKLKLGVTLTTLSPDVRRLSGLLTLIVSGNGLTELPEAIGELQHLKVLEAENNKLKSLPASLAKCPNLEILRVAHNQLTTLAPLEKVNNLVTLIVDSNQLKTLDDFNVEGKERLVTLSARMNKITDAPESIYQCTLLAEIFLRGNKIEELPGEWGELKEKKVRAIELEDNPISDPKVRKMLDKSATFVKELLTYLRKNGKKSAGKKQKKAEKVASESEASEVDEDDVAPALAASKLAPKSEAKIENAENEQSETEEELEERMAKMNKKEREKFKRKLAEERLAKEAKEGEAKRKASDAAAAARMQAAKTMENEGDKDDDSDVDSDDEMAVLARKKKLAGKSAGFLYTMTDEQRAEAQKNEAARLLALELAKQAEEDAKKAAEDRAALEIAARMQGVKLTGDGVYGWEYTGAAFKATRVPTLPKGAKGPCVEVEIPKIIVGKIIGQKGATIKGIQDRSKAMVSIDEAKSGSGNSLLRVRGDEPAMESARMLLNNALASKR